MCAYFRAFSVELRRSLLSGSSLVMLLLLVAWQFFNVLFNILSNTFELESWVTLLDWGNNGWFCDMLLVIATIGYAWSYCQDSECGYRDQALGRVGIGAYCLSKILAVILSAFFTAVVAVGAFALFWYVTDGPVTDPENVGVSGYLRLVAEGKTGLYLLFRLCHTGLICAWAAVTGLAVSAFVRNTYITILSPLLLYMILNVGLRLAGVTFLSRWYPKRIFFEDAIAGNDVASFLWSMFLILDWIFLAGYVFYRKVERRR